MDMVDEIRTPDRAERWLEAALADKRMIMGFGHRVYKHGDSRVPTMRATLGDIAGLRDGQRLLDIYETLARPNATWPHECEHGSHSCARRSIARR